jgi:hypothetical protein
VHHLEGGPASDLHPILADAGLQPLGVSIATILPWSMIAMRSQFSASSMWCVVRKIVMSSRFF